MYIQLIAKLTIASQSNKYDAELGALLSRAADVIAKLVERKIALEDRLESIKVLVSECYGTLIHYQTKV